MEEVLAMAQSNMRAYIDQVGNMVNITTREAIEYENNNNSMINNFRYCNVNQEPLLLLKMLFGSRFPSALVPVVGNYNRI